MRVFVCLLAVLRIYTVTVLAIKTKGDMVLSPYSPGLLIIHDTFPFSTGSHSTGPINTITKDVA